MKVEFHLEKQKEPTAEKGVKVVYGAAKRGGYKVRWYLILALVLSPLLLMLYFFYRQYVLVYAPGIVTVEPVTLTAPKNSVVVEIDITKGLVIEDNQVLIKLENRVLNSDITFLQAELLQLRKEQRNEVVVNFDNYRTAMKDATDNSNTISNIKKEYDKYNKAGQVSKVDYASIVNLDNTAQQALTNAKIEYNLAYITEFQRVLAGPVIQARRDLRQVLANKQSQKANLTIRGPFEGSVVDILVTEGQRITEGEAIVTIAPVSPPRIIGYLRPRFIKMASLGSEAEIIFPDGSSHLAKVTLPTEIASTLPPQLAKPFEGQPALLKVTLSFIDPPEKSQWVEGMPVEVRF